MKERIMWIDEVRGLAMLSILLFHTEMYYVGNDILPYAMFVENALALFFFLSGYLFVSASHPFLISAKMQSVLRRLIIPYLFFTLLIALPKAWVHHNELSLGTIFTPIVTGKASWFVAALILAEIYYALIQYLLGKCCVSKCRQFFFEACCMLSPVICCIYLPPPLISCLLQQWLLSLSLQAECFDCWNTLNEDGSSQVWPYYNSV